LIFWVDPVDNQLAEGIQIVDLPTAREHPAAIDTAPTRALFETNHSEFLLSFYKARIKVADALRCPIRILASTISADSPRSIVNSDHGLSKRACVRVFIDWLLLAFDATRGSFKPS